MWLMEKIKNVLHQLDNRKFECPACKGRTDDDWPNKIGQITCPFCNTTVLHFPTLLGLSKTIANTK